MDPFLIVLTFIISSCIVLFALLPIGIRPSIDPSPFESTGAPQQSYFARKALIAAGLGALITGLIVYIMDAHLISFSGGF